MTDNEMRIAIAQACLPDKNWHISKIGNVEATELRQIGQPCTDGGVVDWESAPDYLNDLNATHKAEMVLSVSEQETYVQMLCCLNNKQKIKPTVDGYYFIAVSATARQRCEAFLKVKGLWRDTAQKDIPHENT